MYLIENKSITKSDYYPFGAPMPGRGFLSSNGYKYGFGGQMKDNEISGNGNSYSAEFWQYDSRLGKRWNIDPFSFDWQSPYSCFNNNPIYFADPLGLNGEERTKKKAEKYQKKNGGEIVKTKDGYSVDIGYAKQNEKGEIKELGVVSKIFKTTLFDKIAGFFEDAGNWIHNTDFVVEVGGKIDVGVQARLKGSYAGVLQGQANVNLVSYELLQGKVDLTELGSDNPDAYNGDYIGSGSGVKVKQSIGVTGGVAGYDILGAEVNHTFKTHGEGSFNDNVDYGVYAVVPLLKTKKANQVQNDVFKQAAEATGILKSPQMKNPKIGKQKDFYGIDIGAGAALILGVEVSIKAGFKR